MDDTITIDQQRREQCPDCAPAIAMSSRLICRVAMDRSLPVGPHAHVTILADLDVNHVRAATDRAILDVFLLGAGRKIDRQDNLLAARFADVSGIVVHFGPANACCLQHMETILPLGRRFTTVALHLFC